ncbi:Gds1p KNAG_0E00310 [Huiozyma naganishii CBS 8797]|uniref:GDS1 winged helix domain-containing protein n=1 Tax=Huiozyma naganishii (strain ATCC MYA-139 / BCRC 22969 / CBS 8797 / KCTC 17520 / NBRC 10181 / NCYC 3082 / Yp74L-3) TaxID=1071383 RepID=J7S6B6_HUIN7|nr:hypothetical protein KNAG_0E00310 [Kazachstania naganishii CBS 8797]CCK70299.1 hypothetical protein KNAG_0E00310 [Kazachstania naganishii CBS 8797]
MALTNPRPLQLLTQMDEHDLLHNSALPLFQFNGVSFPGSETVDVVDINPNLAQAPQGPQLPSSASPLVDGAAIPTDETKPSSGKGKGKRRSSSKKELSAAANGTNTAASSAGSSYNAKNNNPLIEVSKLIPVTGERPLPTDRAGPLEDDVLHAVFIILFESDPSQAGITVKQICDQLLVKHPEMSNLSTKLSNLISAKLNAYVKKIEKGEKTLVYAISREWSNSSPRRMLYIYRGILSPDYKEHAQLVTTQLKEQMGSSQTPAEPAEATTATASAGAPVTASSTDILVKSGSNMNFTLTPEYNIPYAASPVSATLTSTSPNNNNKTNEMTNNTNACTDTSNELMKPPLINAANTATPGSRKRTLNNNNTNKGNNDSDTSNDNKKLGKAMKLSHSSSPRGAAGPLSSPNGTNIHTGNSSIHGSTASLSAYQPIATPSNSSYVTAVAQTPRISKLLPKNGFQQTQTGATSSQSLTNICRLLEQHPPRTESKMDSDDSGGIMTKSAAHLSTDNKDKTQGGDNDWVAMVRNGFLVQEIASPESVSLDDLDCMF